MSTIINLFISPQSTAQSEGSTPTANTTATQNTGSQQGTSNVMDRTLGDILEDVQDDGQLNESNKKKDESKSGLLALLLQLLAMLLNLMNPSDSKGGSGGNAGEGTTGGGQGSCNKGGHGSGTAPTQPAPTQPTPTQPAPTQPAPNQPAPNQPAPTKPAPTEHETTKPDTPKVPPAPPAGTNEVAKNVASQQPELWKKINESFKKPDGTVDAAARDGYLAQIAGDDGLSRQDTDRLNWRFNDRGDKPVVTSADDFKSKMTEEGKATIGSTDGKYLEKFLDQHKNNPYVLDQLHTRFDQNIDGKLDNKEAAGLDQYIEGRVKWDDAKAAGSKRTKEDFGRLEGEGARPKPEAVSELIADPTVIKRMPAGSFDGDNIGGGNSRDAYMDDVGGYLEK